MLVKGATGDDLLCVGYHLTTDCPSHYIKTTVQQHGNIPNTLNKTSSGLSSPIRNYDLWCVGGYAWNVSKPFPELIWNNHNLRAISHKMFKISIIDILYYVTAVSQMGHWFNHSTISLRHLPFGCRTGRRRTASGMRPYCMIPWMTLPIPCRHHVLASSHPWSARKWRYC